MSIAAKIQEARIKHISITKESIVAELIDGRTISVPLAWSWRLSEATLKQRANWKIIGDGQGVQDLRLSSVRPRNRLFPEL
jgi:hypothetical protein